MASLLRSLAALTLGFAVCEQFELQFAGNGCCRFDDYRAEARGVMAAATCGELCMNDQKCVAMEVGPNGDQWNCFLLFGSIHNFHLACQRDHGKCFRKRNALDLREAPQDTKVAPTSSPEVQTTKASQGPIAAIPHWAQAAAVTDHNPRTDLSLVANVGVGTPAQNFTLLIDTVFSGLWVPAKGCIGCPGRGGFSAYDSARSSSAHVLQEARLSNPLRGNDAAEGHFVQDTLTIAGITVPQQIFLAANKAISSIDSIAFDGVLGLAIEQQSGLFNSLAAAEVQPMFTVLPRSPGNPPKLLLGANAYKHVVAASTLQWLHSKSDRFWIVEGKVVFKKSETRNMLLDTATLGLKMPREDIAEVLRSIAPWIQGQRCTLGAAAFCPCSDVSEMRPLEILLQGQSFELFPKEDFFEPTGGPMGSGPSPEEPACRLLIDAAEESTNAGVTYSWVLGASFLRRAVTIFDMENSRIGFAQPAATAGIMAQTHMDASSRERRLLASRLALAVAAALLATACLVAYSHYAWRSKGPPSVQRQPSFNGERSGYVAS